MSDLTVADILNRAADLIEPEGAWTQGTFAKDAAGRRQDMFSPDATCFCVAGAIHRIEGRTYRAWNVFDGHVRKRGYRHMADFNDQRTQSEVVAALRQAARSPSPSEREAGRMDRERLTILRDHLASLPDERVDMGTLVRKDDCGTVACISGWARVLFGDGDDLSGLSGGELLGLRGHQPRHLFLPVGWNQGRYTRTDAIAAIQSMLDSPSDNALPTWPEAGVGV